MSAVEIFMLQVEVGRWSEGSFDTSDLFTWEYTNHDSAPCTSTWWCSTMSNQPNMRLTVPLSVNQGVDNFADMSIRYTARIRPMLIAKIMVQQTEEPVEAWVMLLASVVCNLEHLLMGRLDTTS
jgi:hypothetical protein